MKIKSGSVNENRPSPLANWLFVQMQNSRTIHHRIMARFLRKRGWVCFYLEPQARFCIATKRQESDCWLELYVRSERHDSK